MTLRGGFGRSSAYIAAVAVAAVAAAPQAALADGGPPAAIAQYVEMVPTASGGHAASGKGVRKLPSKTLRSVHSQGGSEAALLVHVASDSAYGAPTATAPEKRVHPSHAAKRAKPVAKPARDRPAPVFVVPDRTSALDAIGATAGGTPILLLAILAVAAGLLAGRFGGAGPARAADGSDLQ